MQTKRILCGPEIVTPMRAELDKFRGVAVLEGEWKHPTRDFTVHATPELIEELAKKWNEYRSVVEVATPEGHTRQPSKNKGYLDTKSEARVIEVEAHGRKRKALEIGFDIRDPEYVAAARAGTLGRSVGLDDDYRVSTADGKVHHIGTFLDHVCFTSNPVVTGMPPLEPVIELSKEGDTQFEFVPTTDLKEMASRLVTWQDPPADVTNGSKKSTHQECGYTAGTPESNCCRCLAYGRDYDKMSDKFMEHCAWVSDPIQCAGVCKYFRPRTYTFSVDEVVARELAVAVEDVPLVCLAKDQKKPYGDVSYADVGSRTDGICRLPIDTADHVRASWNSLSKQTSSSHKYPPTVESAVIDAWKRLVDNNGTPPGAKIQGANAMDLKQLSKELGVAETEDPKVLAKALEDRGRTAAIAEFGKTFSVDETDPDKFADAVRAKITEAAEKSPAVLAKFTELESSNKTLKSQLDKSDEQIRSLASDRELDRAETALARISSRIEKSQQLGKTNKAEVDSLLALGKDAAGKDQSFLLEFDRDAGKYDAAWRGQLNAIEFYLSKVEGRKEFSVVPKETTQKVLGKEDPIGEDDTASKEKLAKRIDARAAAVNPKPTKEQRKSA